MAVVPSYAGSVVDVLQGIVRVTLVLGDIDHFKKVNGAFGQATSDDVLREVASRPGDSVRTYDAVSRYGGEEF